MLGILLRDRVFQISEYRNFDSAEVKNSILIPSVLVCSLYLLKNDIYNSHHVNMLFSSVLVHVLSIFVNLSCHIYSLEYHLNFLTVLSIVT